MSTDGGPLQLDLEAILHARIGRKMRYIPPILVKALERVICQDRLNTLLRNGYPKRGSAFCRSVLSDLDITLDVRGMENIPAEGRFIFASNHPLGGLDGISLIAVLGEKYGDDHIKFLVNDMLMNVEPLAGVFLPINKYGSQGRRAAAEISAAYDGSGQMVIFPAGLVSRLQDDGSVRDLKWHKAFVAKAIDSGRDIIPVRFEGLNRRRFYRLARWRKKLGIKINIEQATLPSEVVAAEGKQFRIIFGTPVSVDVLRRSGKTPAVLADEIKQRVYSL